VNEGRAKVGAGIDSRRASKKKGKSQGRRVECDTKQPPERKKKRRKHSVHQRE
jgi:hypothetical protein